jgi:hypothetical protein
MSINNIDKIFRNGLRDNQVAAPDYAWEQISDNLASNRRDKRRFWFAAASVTLLLGVGALWLNMDGGQTQQVAGSEQTESQPAIEAAGVLEAPSFADSAVYIIDEELKD